MTKLLHYMIILGLWAVQGSHGQLLAEPTQGSKVGDHDRPPEPTRIADLSELKHKAKRQETSQSESDLVVTIASDETCGFLSARPALPITCENTRTCMWASDIGIICGDIDDKLENWQVRIRCMDREMALNPSFCNDTCIDNPLFLLCTEESAPYCATYIYPDAIRDYRCSKTPASRASSVAFTYSGQDNVEFITTNIPLTGSISISTTTTSSSSSSTESSSSTIPASSSPSPDPPPSQNNLGAIIGGAIGGFAAVSLVILAIVWFIRQSRKKKHHPPTEVSPMEQTPLSDPNARKPDTTSPVQSDWRSSTMTALSSPHSTSPQAWVDHPVSPSAQSDTSQGILPHMGQHLAYEMSGESVPPREQERRESRVYEMAGDSNHPWV